MLLSGMFLTGSQSCGSVVESMRKYISLSLSLATRLSLGISNANHAIHADTTATAPRTAQKMLSSFPFQQNSTFTSLPHSHQPPYPKPAHPIKHPAERTWHSAEDTSSHWRLWTWTRIFGTLETQALFSQRFAKEARHRACHHPRGSLPVDLRWRSCLGRVWRVGWVGVRRRALR